jgi:hypothetical protein
LAESVGVWHASSPLQVLSRRSLGEHFVERRRKFGTSPTDGEWTARRRRRVESTDERAELKLRLKWLVQAVYET